MNNSLSGLSLSTHCYKECFDLQNIETQQVREQLKEIISLWEDGEIISEECDRILKKIQFQELQRFSQHLLEIFTQTTFSPFLWNFYLYVKWQIILEELQRISGFSFILISPKVLLHVTKDSSGRIMGGKKIAWTMSCE